MSHQRVFLKKSFFPCLITRGGRGFGLYGRLWEKQGPSRKVIENWEHPTESLVGLHHIVCCTVRMPIKQVLCHHILAFLVSILSLDEELGKGCKDALWSKKCTLDIITNVLNAAVVFLENILKKRKC